MIVATLTTWEPRIPFLKPTLESIRAQTVVDKVLLLVSPGDESKVPTVPGVHTWIVEDIGPGKKHLGPLFVDPEDYIITFDDDHLYEPDHAEALLAKAKAGVVAGYIGHKVDGSLIEEGPCDFLTGATGWAYKASWLDPDRVLEWGQVVELRDSDDAWLGRLFQDRGLPIETVAPAKQAFRYPTPNFDAYLHEKSLQFHPERAARNHMAMRRAWPERVDDHERRERKGHPEAEDS